MKKAKSDQPDPAAKEEALRIVQKIRKLPPDAQIVMKHLINLLYEAEVKSKPKAGRTHPNLDNVRARLSERITFKPRSGLRLRP